MKVILATILLSLFGLIGLFRQSNRSLSGLHLRASSTAAMTAELIDEEEPEDQRRALQASTRSVLILRIIINGKRPTVSASDLKKYIFDHQNSFKNQMFRCSAGALRIVPSKHGVVDIPLALSPNTNNQQALSTMSLLAAPRHLGVKDVRDAADHVIIVFPSQYVPNLIASGSLGGIASSYKDNLATSLSLAMHEVGHNLGLDHAGYNSKEYGDNTGYMGTSSSAQGSPLRCYNAANHWNLGWYSKNRKTVVPSNNPTRLTVVAFVDHSSALRSDAVIVKVGTNMYLQYNRAKSYNANTGAFADSLVIIQQANGKKTTTLLAGLSKPGKTVFRNSAAVIEVCSVGKRRNGVDYMDISIGKSRTNCPKSQPKSDVSPPHTVPMSTTATQSSWQNPKSRPVVHFSWNSHTETLTTPRVPAQTVGMTTTANAEQESTEEPTFEETPSSQSWAWTWPHISSTRFEDDNGSETEENDGKWTWWAN